MASSGKDISSLSVFIFLAHIPAIPLRHWSVRTNSFSAYGAKVWVKVGTYDHHSQVPKSPIKFTKTIPIFDLNSSLSRHFDKLQIQVNKEWLNNMLISSFGFFKFNLLNKTRPIK